MTQAEGDRHGARKGPAAGDEVNLALMATGGFALVASMAALLGWDGRTALGVLVGGVLAVVNLWVFKRVGQAYLAEKGASRAKWGLIGAFKFVALVVGVGLLVRHDVVGAIPLLVGYGALPVGIPLSNFLSTRFRDES